MAKMKNNGIIEVKIRAPKVKVDNKREVELITVSTITLSEEKIKSIVENLSVENSEIKTKYFSCNTPIKEMQQRKFRSLVKLFAKRCKEQMPKIRVKNFNNMKA